jgi:hypothetical protein
VTCHHKYALKRKNIQPDTSVGIEFLKKKQIATARSHQLTHSNPSIRGLGKEGPREEKNNNVPSNKRSAKATPKVMIEKTFLEFINAPEWTKVVAQISNS